MGKSVRPPELVVELQQLIAGVAKNFLHRAYGTDGLPWGTKLADLEDLVTTLGQAVSQQMLAQALSAQAQQVPPAAQECPGCGSPVEMEQPQPRCVQTVAGEAQWNEPGGYCTRCRRAFFPSVGKPGH